MKIHLYTRSELLAVLEMSYPMSTLSSYTNDELLNLLDEQTEFEDLKERLKIEAEMLS